MNQSAEMKLFFSQLGYLSPSLFIYLIAAVVSLAYMKRAMLPSLLTLAGVTIMASAGIGFAIMPWLYLSSNVEFHQFASLIAICLRCASALGLALVLTAVFVGRGEPADLESRYLREPAEEDRA